VHKPRVRLYSLKSPQRLTRTAGAACRSPEARYAERSSLVPAAYFRIMRSKLATGQGATRYHSHSQLPIVLPGASGLSTEVPAGEWGRTGFQHAKLRVIPVMKANALCNVQQLNFGTNDPRQKNLQASMPWQYEIGPVGTRSDQPPTGSLGRRGCVSMLPAGVHGQD
jgi:hypothetical protein